MQSATEFDSDLLNARQVQQLLHIDRSTIYRMASDGRLPSVRVGKQLRFPAAGIQALVGACETPAGSDESNAPDPNAAHAAVAVASELLDVMMVVTDMTGRPLTPIVHAPAEVAARTDDPDTWDACLTEWQALATDPDLAPRFRPGALGFDCARAFIRDGAVLTGMVLAGVTSPDGDHRARVLDALPQVAAAIAAAHTATDPTHLSARSNGHDPKGE
jgi:excisionase family DNA binding protein